MVSAPLLVSGPRLQTWGRSDPLPVLLVMRILKLNQGQQDEENHLLPTGSC